MKIDIRSFTKNTGTITVDIEDPKISHPKIIKDPKISRPKNVKDPKISHPKISHPKIVKDPKISHPKIVKDPKISHPKIIKDPKISHPKIIKDPKISHPKIIHPRIKELNPKYTDPINHVNKYEYPKSVKKFLGKDDSGMFGFFKNLF